MRPNVLTMVGMKSCSGREGSDKALPFLVMMFTTIFAGD